jgi:hypothetical protein
MRQKYKGKAVLESDDAIELPQRKDLNEVYYLQKDGKLYLGIDGEKSITASFDAIPFEGFTVKIQFMKNYIFVGFNEGADLVSVWSWLVDAFRKPLRLRSLVLFPELVEWWDIEEVGDILSVSDDTIIDSYKEAVPFLKTVASIKALPRSLLIPANPLEVRYAFLKELEPVRCLFEPEYTQWVTELMDVLQSQKVGEQK